MAHHHRDLNICSSRDLSDVGADAVHHRFLVIVHRLRGIDDEEQVDRANGLLIGLRKSFCVALEVSSARGSALPPFPPFPPLLPPLLPGFGVVPGSDEAPEGSPASGLGRMTRL